MPRAAPVRGGGRPTTAPEATALLPGRYQRGPTASKSCIPQGIKPGAIINFLRWSQAQTSFLALIRGPRENVMLP